MIIIKRKYFIKDFEFSLQGNIFHYNEEDKRRRHPNLWHLFLLPCFLPTGLKQDGQPNDSVLFHNLMSLSLLFDKANIVDSEK